jgi:hypothetical protein
MLIEKKKKETGALIFIRLRSTLWHFGSMLDMWDHDCVPCYRCHLNMEYILAQLPMYSRIQVVSGISAGRLLEVKVISAFEILKILRPMCGVLLA